MTDKLTNQGDLRVRRSMTVRPGDSTIEREGMRMRRFRQLLPLAAAVPLVAFVAAGCGSSSKSGGSPAKGGGTVTLLDAAGGIDGLDPGYWYYQTDYSEVGQTT